VDSHDSGNALEYRKCFEPVAMSIYWRVLIMLKMLAG
jgi:hypothetical protein